ncbi:MAG: cytoplasmic protein [Proteobacteria bacterium]|uniref:Cytoplasmic protein n=1 Tax=Candidatus Avisuccinivibrio stercorigallinarum TaxID=2840704 RepID=A0A9D9GSG0_9GAMM|nr:cytoplasmic protein [Candidatus Avisuccinivibrio stercorigallinarum]
MKVLLLGESWSIHMIHSKGFDSFTSTKYEEGAAYLINSLKERGVDVVYMPAHTIQTAFPRSAEELAVYDAVIISDVGSNTFLLQNDTFYNMKMVPNALNLIKDYVTQGGGFLMIGGYLSFMGIEGKANYKRTVISEILPVEMLDGDDRVEVPEGITAEICMPEHESVKGFKSAPCFLGYNQLIAKPGAEVVMKVGADPLLVFGTYEKGKTACFASDCSPHWGCLDFLKWEHYGEMWLNIMKAIAR